MRGVRFAPSPTGAFHVGNFRTAWISHWWARALGEPWVVRFEDIDSPRVIEGAQARQLSELGELGLIPDAVAVQSESVERHWQAFARAIQGGEVYPCFCSRKDVQAALEAAPSAPHGRVPQYSGRCRTATSCPETRPQSIAWRFRMPAESGADDFIVARTAPVRSRGALPARESFVPAYNWACAVDDYDGQYRLLVRAHDLAHVVPQQQAIAKLLQKWDGGRGELSAVFHCALVTRDDGARLEKRTQGVTWPELKARGLDRAKLVACFERSYPAPDLRLASAGRVFGENRETLTLGELLA